MGYLLNDGPVILIACYLESDGLARHAPTGLHMVSDLSYSLYLSESIQLRKYSSVAAVAFS